MTDLPIQFLQWDSDFFGHRIARINTTTADMQLLQQIDDWCEAEQIDCVYFQAEAEDIQTLQIAPRMGYEFQGLQLEVSRPLQTLASDADVKINPDVIIRKSIPDDVESICAISRRAYSWTRFYNDAKFDNDRADDLYDTWMRKSVLENYVPHVQVAELNGEVVGYTSLKYDKTDQNTGMVDLIAVNPAMQGQRIGQTLILACVELLKQEGKTQFSLSTQGRNMSLVRFYERLGFKSTHLRFWYHKWYR